MGPTQFRSTIVDGRVHLIPVLPDIGHRNPPLSALNTAYRADDDDRRDETRQVVAAVGDATANALAGRSSARRTQKPLKASNRPS